MQQKNKKPQNNHTKTLTRGRGNVRKKKERKKGCCAFILLPVAVCHYSKTRESLNFSVFSFAKENNNNKQVRVEYIFTLSCISLGFATVSSTPLLLLLLLLPPPNKKKKTIERQNECCVSCVCVCQLKNTTFQHTTDIHTYIHTNRNTQDQKKDTSAPLFGRRHGWRRLYIWGVDTL